LVLLLLGITASQRPSPTGSRRHSNLSNAQQQQYSTQQQHAVLIACASKAAAHQQKTCGNLIVGILDAADGSREQSVHVSPFMSISNSSTSFGPP
jgi:hypothetical protein